LSLYQSLAYYEWFSAKQIKVIYNGLESFSESGDPKHWREQFGIPEGALVFGTIARFDSIKNIPMMINAFKEVHGRNPNTCLLLVGDGKERPMLEEAAREAGVAGSVIFTGFQQETAKLMSLIDIYLLSSFSEGTSMTLLEAMSSGTCSIVTRVGGNVELIEHESSGVIVDSEDTAALASWMSELAANPDKRRTFGNEATKVFNKHFSIISMLDGYSLTYEKALRIS
jgi:glycosyltransferase involved in cell wall biosynthesis